VAALAQLDEQAELARVEQEAIERGVLGASALEVLSLNAAQHGHLERAIEYRTRQLDPDLPVGLEHVNGRGTWATRLALAELYDKAGQPSAALEQLEQAFELLPTEQRAGVAVRALAYALQAGALEAAGRWAPRAIACAPDALDQQQQLLQLIVQLYTRQPGLELDTPWSAIDRALAGDDLQLIYDLGCEIAPETHAGLARLLAVIERVRAADEHQAALGLLNRALDGPKTPTVYWLLVQTLTELGRYQDAQLAVEALRALQQATPEPAQKAA
jgi:tetratricopeptide (TPR) repeat protein